MPRNLLVVDDSATVRDAVRLALTGEDWTVTAVGSTAEAVEALARSIPNAVLCDVAVGEEDGYDACRSLRAAAPGAEFPILLMGSKVSETLATSAGATAVLAKPFHSDELAEALRNSLEQASLAAVEDDFLSFEPVLPAAEGEEPPGPGGTDDEQVEIIDLSDEDDLGELEFLDLEPVPAGQGAAPPDREELRPLSGEDLDFLSFAPPSAAAEEPRAPAAEAPGSGAEHLGPVEFDLGDFEAEAGEEPAEEERAGAFRPELDLATLEAEEPAPAAPAGGPADDLLADIDLEGWAEEDLEPAPPAAPPALGIEEPLPRPVPAPSAPGSEDSFDFGLDDLEPLALTEEEREAAPASLLETEAEAPLDLGEEEETEILEEEQDAGADETWAAEPAETLAAAEPERSEPEPGDLLTEPAEEREPWATEPPAGEEPPPAWATPAAQPENAAPEAAAEPEPAPVETDETWASPPPTPSAEVPWDREAPEPEPLAQRVAAGAGEAVRRALEESLSTEALTPLVQATVERVVWEVVPQLAERLIREAIERLQQEPDAD